MLVRFSSVETRSVLMFGDIAVSLIKMMGATGKVPGAISAEDIPAALTGLREQLEIALVASAGATDPADNKNVQDDEPPISLKMRAGPLIQILQRAAVAGAAVMWEKE
ncbi:MAG: DUF1840 domain-containing protein [Xanthomonadales bacterium]|nr:DUF1840 domain-containing protein [Xanthomonadales bacterium]